MPYFKSLTLSPVVAPGDLVWFLGGVVTMPCDGKAVLRLVVAADDVTVVLCIRGCFNSDP